MAKVSIITPYRNAACFLPGLVETLCQQTFADWECLLIDDNSIDGGPLLLENLTDSDSRFRHLALPRCPVNDHPHIRLPAIPRNLGLNQVASPLVAFLDVDDLWHPRKLELQLEFHSAHQLDLSVTAYGRFLDMEQPVVALRCPPFQMRMKQLLQHNPLPLLTVVISRELFEGGFYCAHHEDYLQWLNLKLAYPALRYGCLNEILACYRLHSNNLTSRRPALLAWTYRVFRLHGLGRGQSLLRMGHWGFHHATTLVEEWRLRSRPLPKASVLLSADPPFQMNGAP